MSLAERWLKGAYQGSRWLAPLYPLALLYRYIMSRRSASYNAGKQTVYRAPVPVLVVGNITLGGTGKSPLVAWLVRWLTAQGYTPGVVTRGYGGKAEYPLSVTADTDPALSGDEPLMLAQQTGVAVVADPQRGRGVEALIGMGCDIVVSDDGLQHLALARDIELVVIDGARGLGNGRCLPAGPLRESPDRLATVDAVVVNGAHQLGLPVSATPMTLTPQRWRRLVDGYQAPLMPLPFSLPVYAMAGIGNPERFFDTLRGLGVVGEMRPLADHQHLDAQTLRFAGNGPLLMTAKDGVKCQTIAPYDSWILEVEATLPPAFEHWLAARLSALLDRERRDG